MNTRAKALAQRIEQGASALATFAEGLSDAQWITAVLPDGRSVGIIVHHVASMYPIEIQLATLIASGKPVEGVTWAVVADINAKHAHDYADVGSQGAVDLLRGNSRAAAEAVRAFTDEQLDRATLVSLYGNAPETAQFMIEDHALRHSWHHLAGIKAALQIA